MASIEKRPDGTYRARWREFPGGPQKTKHFDRKGDAERFTDALRGDLARGVYIDPQAGRIRFQDYAEQWRAGQLHRRSTATQTETYLRLHAYPIFGHLLLGAVRRSDIQSWVKGRSEVLAPGSVELVYRWVATIFKSAVADRLIPASPCLRITLPKKTRAEIIPLSVEQVTLLADSMPRCYRALVLFSAGTGMRQGECFGLTVDRIDFLRRTVRVDRQLVGAVGGVPEFGPPKSEASQRTVPLPATVVALLAAHLAEHGEGPQRLVFTNTEQRPLRRNTFNTAWHRAADANGLPGTATFHDLRHFYASLLIARGCSVKAVQHRLGHNSAMETLDTYAHLWPDSDNETREAVDGAFASIRIA